MLQNTFQIVGNIGKIEELNGAMRLSLASNSRYRDERGDWQERTRWNSVTVFSDKIRSFLKSHGSDIRSVMVRGEVYDDSYTDRETGEIVYKVQLTVLQLDVMSWKNRPADAASSPAGNDDPDDIAF